MPSTKITPKYATTDPDSNLPLLFNCISGSKLLILTLHLDFYTKILIFFVVVIKFYVHFANMKWLKVFCMDREKVVSLLVCFIAFPRFLFISYNQKRKKRFWCSCAFLITSVVRGADRDMMACLVV